MSNHTNLLAEARRIPQPIGGTQLITRLVEECERLMRYNIEVQESLQEAHVKYVKDTDILFLVRKAAERERDAALAVVAAVQLVIDEESIPDEVHGDNWVMVDDLTAALQPPTTPAHPPLSTTGAESDTGTHTEHESAADGQGETNG